ncbi:MAG TPA: aminotransferase class V-fold PLP-dependent enzyme, partial [Anaerolineales bacterium]|nr:aminotransferase class V-fold PLP-dependent enzyme [Anaerolineales bacterium]
PVSSDGQIDPVEVERRLKGNTCLVSVIYANNEIGTVNPVAEIGRVCRERGIPFHTDALQAALSLELNVDLLSLDLASLGAHKFYGPKGVGVLFIRKGISIQPIQTGGEQESGMRGGTLNVPSIVGMAVALKIARQELSEFTAWIEPLRDRLVARILASVPESQMTGHPVDRLPYHASFVFKDIDGNLLLNLLDSAGFACSSGSACKTGSPAPSDVLLATGLSPDWALGSLRVTLGRWTTEEDVEAFCDTLPEIVERGRRLSAL